MAAAASEDGYVGGGGGGGSPEGGAAEPVQRDLVLTQFAVRAVGEGPAARCGHILAPLGPDTVFLHGGADERVRCCGLDVHAHCVCVCVSFDRNWESLLSLCV